MDFRLLMDLRQFLTVKHHVPGRIRIKFSLKLLGDPRAERLKEEMSSTAPPPCIRSSRLNVLGRSVVIEYDPSVIDPAKLNEAFTTRDKERFEALVEEFEHIMSA